MKTYSFYSTSNINNSWVIYYSWIMISYSYNEFCDLVIKYNGELSFSYNTIYFKTKEKMQNFIDDILTPLIIMKKLSGEL